MGCKKPPCLTNGLFFRRTIQGDDGVGGCWILGNFVWNDSCSWDDTETWND